MMVGLMDREDFIKYGDFKKNEKNYMSDVVPEEQQKKSIKLAENHVDWLLAMLRPLMIEEFKHGYRHGFEEANILTYEKQHGLYRNDSEHLKEYGSGEELYK